MQPDITAFFDHKTVTVGHIASDRKERRCATIDAALDYDPKSGRTSTHSVIPINNRAGHLPPSENDGVSYLKIPIDAV